MKKHSKIVGRSYYYRIKDILDIYDEHAPSGLSNREILRRFIWPKYHICEKTFYNIINASASDRYLNQARDMDSQLNIW